MRLTAVEVGFFEDREDEEILDVAFTGTDEAGERRSFSVQRSTHEPDEQDVRLGMDSYCVSTERGFSAYGCLSRVRLGGGVLTLEFTPEDADVLEIPRVVEIDLAGSAVDEGEVSRLLRDALDWGSPSKRPELVLSGGRPH
ncbi:Imm10 family immunity protein [Kribbella sp. NPDC051770]|uniref:Imm10 family immunity protein n=1 Tax=Kribbella sp. NPDC051770 TaxID=3155413 RepID=UPI003435FBDA